MRSQPHYLARLTQPLRTLAQRFAFGLLVLGALALMVIGRTDPEFFARTKLAALDIVAPVLAVISQPLAAAHQMADNLGNVVDIYRDNERLRAENQRLLKWQSVATHLETENLQLRNLLNFSRDDALYHVTGRVVGDGGAFVRTLLLNAGQRDGVRKGQAATNGAGLIGRVTDVGERSSRVLLITDLNSRVPVVIAETRVRAVLAGDNSAYPKLIYLSADSELAIGQHVVTSGHGGAFPPGMPIGVVSSADENGVAVTPLVAANGLEYIQLLDFGLNGILPDPHHGAIQAETTILKAAAGTASPAAAVATNPTTAPAGTQE